MLDNVHAAQSGVDRAVESKLGESLERLHTHQQNINFRDASLETIPFREDTPDNQSDLGSLNLGRSFDSIARSF